VKVTVIVVAWFAQLQKILTRLRHQITINNDVNFTPISDHLYVTVHLLFFYLSIDFVTDLLSFEISVGNLTGFIRCKTGAGDTGRVVVGETVVFVYVILDRPLDETFDIFSSFLVKFDFLLDFKLFLLLLFVCFLFDVDFIHNFGDSHCLLYAWFIILDLKEYVLLNEIELLHWASLCVLGVLYSDDVAVGERHITHQINVVFCLLVKLKNGIVRVHISWCFDAYNMRVVSEDLVADGVLILTLLVLWPMHLDEIIWFQRFARNGILLEFLNEGYNVEHLKYIPINSTHGILEWTQR
jgi:hypothetical protein